MECPKVFIGCTVAITCGTEKYEGIVKSVDVNNHAIVLSEVCLNDLKLSLPELTLSATGVTDLKILQMAKDKRQKDSGKTDDGGADKKKKGFNSPREQRVTKTCETGKKLHSKQKHAERDEQCFGDSALSPTLPDFDFEKNLALFDKETMFEKLKQDLGISAVKTVESSEKKLKPHEHVLEKEPVSLRQIKGPQNHVGREYSSDSGLIVPAISLELRQRLLEAAAQTGLSLHQLNETAGICTCLMAVQLLGGNSRVCPKNSHQSAEIVILAGPHTQGLQAVTAARHLANHTINVKLLVPNVTAELQTAVSLFQKSDGALVHAIRELPQHPVDLIIDALIGHDHPDVRYDWLNSAVRWANQNKAPVLSLDPCRHAPLDEEIDIKWAVAMALPLINAPKAGRLYVADLGIPRGIFKEVGIAYHSPFLDKFFVALYE